MSDGKTSTVSFLRRWSSRKRAAECRAQEADRHSNVAAPSGAAAPAFDPTALPPIDSIGAASDIRALLASNVPIELQRAALRQLWLSDPTIRDFIGIAENQWDFTKPDTVPGFGSLELTPDLRRAMEEFFGAGPERATVQQVASVPGLPPAAAQHTTADGPIAVDENKAKSGTELSPDVPPVPDKRDRLG